MPVNLISEMIPFLLNAGPMVFLRCEIEWQYGQRIHGFHRFLGLGVSWRNFKVDFVRRNIWILAMEGLLTDRLSFSN
jgi:hypothetical protein